LLLPTVLVTFDIKKLYIETRMSIILNLSVVVVVVAAAAVVVVAVVAVVVVGFTVVS